jgi:predicted ribosome quality control (RQC) complex YloA/Tae2 family protein
MGDLLLANAANARREGDKIFVTDFFDEATPEIAIEADENLSVTEAAEKFFKRYTKARNAAGEIAKRLDTVQKELARLKRERSELEEAIERKDEFISAEPSDNRPSVREKKGAIFNGARRFLSSDGFEILVGKKAKDNDHLTFRIAGSLDMWLHAADYPGSHVVIRNPSRKEIPQRTLLEAAQLAAFYSDAGQQTKAAVHYTQKKFVNKPRGAAPGLVSLASFKTILVEPKVQASAIT